MVRGAWRKWALLAALPGLALVHDDDLSDLAERCVERRWNAHEPVVLHAATGIGGCVVIVRGRLVMFSSSAPRRVDAGDFVALLEDSVLAEAETDTVALVLDVGLPTLWRSAASLSRAR